MQKTFRLLLGIACGLALCLSQAQAAFDFGVDSTLLSPTPGSSGFITIFVNNTGAPALADSAVVNLSVGAAGGATVGQLGFVGPGAVAPGSSFNLFFSQVNTPPTTWQFSSNNFSAVPIPTGRTNLYQIPYTISLATPLGGQFTFNIPATGAGGIATQFAAGGNSLSPTLPGTFTLTVVPEPSSFGLCCIGLVAAARLRRRRNNR